MNKRLKAKKSSQYYWPKEALETLGVCPICSSARRELLYDELEDYAFECAPGKWTMYHCESCGVAYLDPRPDQETIGLAYKKYYTHQATDSNNSQIQNLKVAMLNGYINMRFGVELSPSSRLGILYYLVPGRRKGIDSKGRGLDQMHDDKAGKVLDVGCGNGKFLAFAKMIGWQAFGVDPDHAAIKVAREFDVEILGSFIDDVPEEYNGEFDFITLNHVIEHVHNPLAMIKKCHDLLGEEGRLWIETPNIDSQGHQRYGKYWRGLEAPRHLVVFNWGSLQELLEEAGFTEIRREVSPPVCKWIFKQSLLQTDSNWGKNGVIGKIKFSLIVLWSNLRARVDPSRHELVFYNAIK